MLSQFLDALRHSLSSAIGDAFLISLAVIIAAWVVTLFLKGIPREEKEQDLIPTDEPD